MPNHITNIINVREGNFQNFLNSVKGKNTEFDFGNIVPEPNYENKSNTIRQSGSKLLMPDWYTWRCDNWGTKWNAYDIIINHEDHVIQFDTAWSTPVNIWNEIAKQYKDMEFHIKYADEDYGYNCGTIIIKNGSVEFNALEGGSDQAYQLAAFVRFGTLDPDKLKEHGIGPDYRWLDED